MKRLVLAASAALLLATPALALAPDVVAWGNAADTCLKRPAHKAAAACYVVPKGTTGLAIFCPPPVTADMRSIADGCSFEATKAVIPPKWSGK